MMNRIAPRLSLTLVLLGVAPAGLAAQIVGQPGTDNTGYGSTSAEFLLLGANARGAALGGAYAAIATDVSALYYNPAGAALITRPGLEIGTYDYIAGTRYSWGGLAFPVSGGVRTIGLQLGTFGFSDQPVYDEQNPNGTGGTYSVSETFVGLTYAENFSDRFSAGLTAKYINDRLGTVSGSAFAVDFGTNFHATLNNHPVKFSFTLTNLGSNLNYSGTGLRGFVPRDPIPGEDPIATLPQQATLDNKASPLPTTFRVGLAYDIMHQSDNRLTVLGDFNQPNSDKPGFVFGTEYQRATIGSSGFGFALRGSWSHNGGNKSNIQSLTTALNDEENRKGLAFGGGLLYQGGGSFKLGIDYAWKYLGVLGGTNFLSFNVGW